MSSFITHVLTRSRDREGAVNKVRETIYRSLTVAAPFVVFTSATSAGARARGVTSGRGVGARATNARGVGARARGAGACAAGLPEGQRL